VGNALIDFVTILENFPLLGSRYSRRLGVCEHPLLASRGAAQVKFSSNVAR